MNQDVYNTSTKKAKSQEKQEYLSFHIKCLSQDHSKLPYENKGMLICNWKVHPKKFYDTITKKLYMR